MDVKKWYESKSIWTGVLIFGASLLTATGILDVDINTNAAWIGTGIGIVQVILRAITGKSISF